MPSKSGMEVARAFALGGKETWTDSKKKGPRFHYDGDRELWSYAQLIGIRVPEVNAVLLRGPQEVGSMTTTRHVTKAATACQKEFVRVAMVPFDGMERAGFDLSDVRSIEIGKAGAHGYWTLEFWHRQIRDFLYVTSVPPRPRTGLIRPWEDQPWGTKGTYDAVSSGTWITRDKPRSLAHLVTSVAPRSVREGLERGEDVFRLGRLFLRQKWFDVPSNLETLTEGPAYDTGAFHDSWGARGPDSDRLMLFNDRARCVESNADKALWEAYELGAPPLQWREPDLEGSIVDLVEWT